MKHAASLKRAKRLSRRGRIRARVSGTKDRPRLSVFRSNTRLEAQLINDENGTTLIAVSSTALKAPQGGVGKALGMEIARRAKEKGVTTVVFDRGGFSYAGNVAAVAEGAREGGLIV